MSKAKHFCVIGSYYFLSAIFLFILPFATERWSTEYDINPNWSWNKDHTTSVTNHYHENYTFFEAVEENVIFLILMLFLIILSIILFNLLLKEKNEDKATTVCRISMFGIGIIMLLCQWIIIGFSFWGTLFIAAFCLVPIFYNLVVEG